MNPIKIVVGLTVLGAAVIVASMVFGKGYGYASKQF